MIFIKNNHEFLNQTNKSINLSNTEYPSTFFSSCQHFSFFLNLSVLSVDVIPAFAEITKNKNIKKLINQITLVIIRYMVINELKKTLKEKNIKVLKSLGQNFLVDENILNKIIQAAELNKNDMVIEVGPGFGVLTKELSEKCKQVIAIEKDKKLAELLEKEFAQNNSTGLKSQWSRQAVPLLDKGGLGRVEILNNDILKTNISRLIKKYNPDGEYKLISNIPYYITSSVIKLFLENKVQPQLIILLVQKEVAERICAGAGKLSILALSVQIYGKPEIIGYVSRSSFYPEPKVDSAILKISEIKKEFSDNYYERIFRIIKIGFSSKRKKLVNNLSAGLHLDKDEAEKILRQAKINPDARAQELELEDWKRLKKYSPFERG